MQRLILRIKTILEKYNSAIRLFKDYKSLDANGRILFLRRHVDGRMIICVKNKKENKYDDTPIMLEPFLEIFEGEGQQIAGKAFTGIYGVEELPEFKGINIITNGLKTLKDIYYNESKSNIYIGDLEISRKDVLELKRSYEKYNLQVNYDLGLSYVKYKAVRTQEMKRMFYLAEFYPFLVKLTNLDNVLINNPEHFKVFQESILYLDCQRVENSTFSGGKIKDEEPGYILYTTRKRYSQVFGFPCRRFVPEFYFKLILGLFSDDFVNPGELVYIKTENGRAVDVITESKYVLVPDRENYKPTKYAHVHLSMYLKQLDYAEKDIGTLYEAISNFDVIAMLAAEVKEYPYRYKDLVKEG